MDDPGIKRFPILKFDRSISCKQIDQIIHESPLEIAFLDQNGQVLSYTTTMRTTGHDQDLIYGLLYTTRVIQTYEQVADIQLTEVDIDFTMATKAVITFITDHKIDDQLLDRSQISTSSCGICGVTSIDQIDRQLPTNYPLTTVKINFYQVTNMLEELERGEKRFHQTGGCHSCALFDIDQEILLCLREDVGRHNALDKIIGWALQSGNVHNPHIALFLSGRVGFELIQKATMAGIRIVVARGAPTDLAIELAESFNMVLLGFTKRSGFNVYSGMDNVII